MALFGNVAGMADRLRHDAHFAPAFAYLELCLRRGSAEHSRLLSMARNETRRVDLGGPLFAIEQVYESRIRSDCFFESHRRHIDVQCLIAGEEGMEVMPISDLTLDAPFREERDLITYRDTDVASLLRIRPGQVAVYFPEDGHMPGLRISGPSLVRKTVVKVPVG